MDSEDKMLHCFLFWGIRVSSKNWKWIHHFSDFYLSIFKIMFIFLQICTTFLQICTALWSVELNYHKTDWIVWFRFKLPRFCKLSVHTKTGSDSVLCQHQSSDHRQSEPVSDWFHRSITKNPPKQKRKSRASQSKRQDCPSYATKLKNWAKSRHFELLMYQTLLFPLQPARILSRMSTDSL